MTNFMLRKVHCLLLTSVLLVMGCGEPTNEVTVTGTVSLDGKPLPAAMVVLQSKDGSFTRSGEMVGGQTFRIPEVPLGTVQVAVKTTPYQHDVRAPKARPGGPPVATGESEITYVRIPKKYENFETSGLEYDIQPGSSVLNIQLQSNP